MILLTMALDSGLADVARHLMGSMNDLQSIISMLPADNLWFISHLQPLVVKPDQLIKRRGKLGLIGVKKSFEQVKQWIGERLNKDQKIGNAVGKLRNFIIEPFVPHTEVSIIDGISPA